MNFLLNMNMPRALGRLLTERGHQARHAGDIGLSLADDLRIIEEAEARGETILTHTWITVPSCSLPSEDIHP